MTLQKAKGMICGFLEGGASRSKDKLKKYYLKIYDTHVNLADNDFVMYRLIHINGSHYVFVI